MYLLLSWAACRFKFIVVIIIIVFSMIISIAILLSTFLMIILRGSDQIIVVFRFWGTRYIPVKDRRKSRIFCLDLTWSFYVLQITVSSQPVPLLFTLFCFILSSLIKTLFPGMLWFLKAHFTSFLQVTITTYDIIRQLAKSILRECLNIVCLFVCLSPIMISHLPPRMKQYRMDCTHQRQVVIFLLRLRQIDNVDRLLPLNMTLRPWIPYE